jgi:hypothetical protein
MNVTLIETGEISDSSLITQDIFIEFILLLLYLKSDKIGMLKSKGMTNALFQITIYSW